MLLQAVNFTGYLLIRRTMQIARTLNLEIQDMISMQELRFPSKTQKHFFLIFLFKTSKKVSF